MLLTNLLRENIMFPYEHQPLMGIIALQTLCQLVVGPKTHSTLDNME